MDPDPLSKELMIKLHRELNGFATRQRRGTSHLTTQLSLDKGKRGNASKSRAKRSTSSSHDRTNSKRRRSSDGEYEQAHTSIERIKQEPMPLDSSDSGSKKRMLEYQRRHSPPAPDSGHERSATGAAADSHEPAGEPPSPKCTVLQALPPAAAAAWAAAGSVKQRVAADNLGAAAGGSTVKVFYAGVRWGISLPRSVVANTQELARALNEAFVGEILSVGQGDSLITVFVDGKGNATEMSLTGGHLHKEAAASWKMLANQAARVYVRSRGLCGGNIKHL